jgi:hypothetical protein
MFTKKSICVLFGILAISVWVLGSALQAGAETKNFKFYGWPSNRLSMPIEDTEGHTLTLTMASLIYMFEDGEAASATSVSTSDMIKKAGQWNQYLTFHFADGSTVIIKGQGITESTASGAYGKARITNELIKGTGRFEGIKGTAAGKLNYMPIEKGELAPKIYGEGTWTYTLPSK